MVDLSYWQIERLRGRAEHCKELARRATSEGVAAELLDMARDYEKDAAKLEEMMPFIAQQDQPVRQRR